MRRLFWVLVFSVMAFAAPAQDSPNRAIESVIQGQIDAFLEDDFATAFSYASPSIKGIFGTPDRFGQMVREGYPMVWRPSDVQFGELREVAGRLWQRVIVRDADGRVHALDYNMIPTEDGWQINGVQLLQAPGLTT